MTFGQLKPGKKFRESSWVRDQDEIGRQPPILMKLDLKETKGLSYIDDKGSLDKLLDELLNVVDLETGELLGFSNDRKVEVIQIKF